MAKKGGTEYACQNCGAVYPKWQGKCDACGEWNTIVEEKVGGEGFSNFNPKKKGIHNEKHFLMPTPENFARIEDEIIKIVTLAPELDLGLIDYLRKRGVKVQAGHCVGGDLSKCDGVTHLFNAMGEINHRDTKTALTALLDDKLYTEVIGDGLHLSDDILELIFRTKPEDKILLISDALPIAKSDLTEMVFADEEIFYDGERATSKAGTIAGSTKLLPDKPILRKN